MDENKEKIDLEQENIEDENLKQEKKGFKGLTSKIVGSVKTGAIKTGGFIKDKTVKITSDIKDYAEAKKEEKRENQVFSTAYENQTYQYEIEGVLDKNGKLKKISAFRYSDKNQLAISLLEENKDIIFSNTILKNLVDKSIVKIVSVDKKETHYHNLVIDDKEQPISCFIVKYENYDPKKDQLPQHIHNEIHQNVNIQGGNTGEINLVSNVENKLDKLENEIRAVKTGMFSKERKAQEAAIKIIGPVKETIISGKKDQSLIDKMIGHLSVFAPVLVEVLKALVTPR